ncbi:hypothetical protein [Pseudobacteriovorax antillogorgiicola]|uniref:PorV/PorQ family protein n=1 Tax=Pseudobacteriovorax antillogorgiicola TaxID=1513793 RepID=A0A1Y6B4P2_9BACT|nr:hypothetical protein [Pseudobacteriovorax antillogorgiicola]TCS59259.1 hypothetical protein EDD56_101164 [Pseudobacteriovorax antillogorgiicola]SME89967.1 hypothetical protein SAMN06296036_101322 [Pseudobacteriovorax antillogorgiicola]
MRIFISVTLTLITLFFGPTLIAKQQPAWTHYGLRPLGMGNAFVAVADDFNALFYNPAGLARLDTWDAELINPTLKWSAEAQGLVEDFQDLGGTSETLELIEKNTGESQMFGLNLTPHLVFRNFGFGLGVDVELSMIFHRDISVDVQSGVTVIMPFSFAFNLLDDRLSLGFSIKARAFGGVDREFSMEDIEALGDNNDSDTTNDDTQELSDFVLGGLGVGTDFGLLFTPTKTLEPTIGLSITDFGGTAYEEANISGEALGAPPVVLPSVNVGLSLKPYKKNRSYVTTAIDMHSINHPYSFSQKLQLGVEYGYGQFFKVQGGLYKGYPTAGLQLDVGIINLRLVTYAEEIGSVAGYQPSRRYALQIKLLF